MDIESRLARLESRVRKWQALCVAALVVAGVAVAVLTARPGVGQLQRGPSAATEGFGAASHEIRFFEPDAKRPTPKVPRTWRLVAATGVANTTKSNLWFQDTDGVVHLLTGSTEGKFTLDDYVQHMTPAP